MQLQAPILPLYRPNNSFSYNPVRYLEGISAPTPKRINPVALTMVSRKTQWVEASLHQAVRHIKCILQTGRAVSTLIHKTAITVEGTNVAQWLNNWTKALINSNSSSQRGTLRWAMTGTSSNLWKSGQIIRTRSVGRYTRNQMVSQVRAVTEALVKMGMEAKQEQWKFTELVLLTCRCSKTNSCQTNINSLLTMDRRLCSAMVNHLRHRDNMSTASMVPITQGWMWHLVETLIIDSSALSLHPISQRRR